jgi:hypothetical protein
MLAHSRTSGTPAAGFGVTQQFILDSATVGSRAALDVVTTWVTATDANRKVRSVFSIYDTAAREALRMEASGTAPMIGFLGASASIALASPDLGTLATTFGLATGTPTFAAANLTGTALPSGLVAAQADQEAGSSTTLAVTPARQHFHPSAAKAFVYWTVSGTTVTVQRSYNVSSVTRNGVGDHTVNFTTSFSDTNYTWAGQSNIPGTATGFVSEQTATPRAVGSLRTTCTPAGGGTSESTSNSRVVFGDL